MLADAELSDLIYAQYVENGRYWDDDEAYRASRRLSSAVVDVTLGSSWVEVTPSVDSHLTISAFMHGACGYLAGELHRVTGLPLVRWTKPDEGLGWRGHWAVEIQPNLYLDVRGLTDENSVLEAFTNSDAWTVEHGPHLYGELLAQVNRNATNVLEDLDLLETALIQRYAAQLASLVE